MKAFMVVFLALASIASAEVDLQENTAYGYLKNVGIPLGDMIRKKEQSRIVGGAPAGEGQYEYQAGLLQFMTGVEGIAVCGGALVSANRVITAAHCWFDGVHQAWLVTVVLGSNRLFSGGTRLNTSVVVTHPNWLPTLVRNDIAMIYLPESVTFSDTIGPLALPSGAELKEDFAGETDLVDVSGFGLTSDSSNLSIDQFLSHVSVKVITNTLCSIAYPLLVRHTNICTSGVGGIGACRGDSGGPLVITRNNNRILIGVVSFGSAFGCEVNLPVVYSRTTSYMDFITQHMDKTD